MRGGVYSGSALIESDRMYLFYTGNVKLPGDYDYIDSGRISTQILTESDDGQHMSGKIKLLGMDDYPENITQHVRGPESVEGERKILHGAGSPRPAHGMRQEDEATRAASLSMIPITGKNGVCTAKSCRNRNSAICGNVRISSAWMRGEFCLSVLRDSPQNRRSTRICTSQVIPCCPHRIYAMNTAPDRITELQSVRGIRKRHFRNGIWDLTFMHRRVLRMKKEEEF